MNTKLKERPKYFRSHVSKGLAKGSRVDDGLGLYGAGMVEGFAVITRGEALGHGFWIDQEFVSQVNEALSSQSQGVKSRFTHPDLSGDGLAKGLGRVIFRESESEDVARGDLHLWKSARRSPDGDLGGYVLQRAEEDPESFGASIAFVYDYDATRAHFEANGGVIVEDPDFGEIWDSKNFKSRDAKNKKQLPHARLALLHAVDIVDDPAANPGGLFHRDETLKEAEGLLEYALGLSDRRPSAASFDVDPDRVGGFIRRFFSSRGLEVMKLKNLNEAGVLEDEKATTTGESGDATKEKDEENAPEAGSATNGGEAGDAEASPTSSSESSGDLSRGEAKRFFSAFGHDRGARYFEAGLTFEQASAKALEELRSENEKLSKKLNALSAGEAPLSSGGADEKRPGGKDRGGFASRIRMPADSKN